MLILSHVAQCNHNLLGDFDVMPTSYRHLLLESVCTGKPPVIIGPTLLHYKRVISDIPVLCIIIDWTEERVGSSPRLWNWWWKSPLWCLLPQVSLTSILETPTTSPIPSTVSSPPFGTGHSASPTEYNNQTDQQVFWEHILLDTCG